LQVEVKVNLPLYVIDPKMTLEVLLGTKQMAKRVQQKYVHKTAKPD
jgi:hypothetical protein